jgi:hypothetical protein
MTANSKTKSGQRTKMLEKHTDKVYQCSTTMIQWLANIFHVGQPPSGVIKRCTVLEIHYKAMNKL